MTTGRLVMAVGNLWGVIEINKGKLMKNEKNKEKNIENNYSSVE